MPVTCWVHTRHHRAIAGPQPVGGEIVLPENSGVAPKSSKVGQPWERSVDDSITRRNKSCDVDEDRMESHAPFHPVQKPLDQTVPRRAEQSSKHRQVKRSDGLNRGSVSSSHIFNST
jgi:hypothetical protein